MTQRQNAQSITTQTAATITLGNTHHHPAVPTYTFSCCTHLGDTNVPNRCRLVTRLSPYRGQGHPKLTPPWGNSSQPSQQGQPPGDTTCCHTPCNTPNSNTQCLSHHITPSPSSHTWQANPVLTPGHHGGCCHQARPAHPPPHQPRPHHPPPPTPPSQPATAQPHSSLGTARPPPWRIGRAGASVRPPAVYSGRGLRPGLPAGLLPAVLLPPGPPAWLWEDNRVRGWVRMTHKKTKSSQSQSTHQSPHAAASPPSTIIVP
jgi:hypothetical protein